MGVDIAPQSSDQNSSVKPEQPPFDYAAQFKAMQQETPPDARAEFMAAQQEARDDLVRQATREQDSKVASNVEAAQAAASALGVNETGSQSVTYSDKYPEGVPTHIADKQQRIDDALARAAAARDKGDELAAVAGKTFDSVQALRGNVDASGDGRIEDVNKARAMAYASREAETNVAISTSTALDNAARLGVDENRAQSTTINDRFPGGERTDLVVKQEAIDASLSSAAESRARADQLADIAAKTYDQAQALRGAGDGTGEGRIEDKEKAHLMANASRDTEANIVANTNQAIREVSAMGTNEFGSLTKTYSEKFPDGEMYHIVDKQNEAEKALGYAAASRAEANRAADEAARVYDQSAELMRPRSSRRTEAAPSTETAAAVTIPEAANGSAADVLVTEPVNLVKAEQPGLVSAETAPVSLVKEPVATPGTVQVTEADMPPVQTDVLDDEMAALRNDFGPGGEPRVPAGEMAVDMAEASDHAETIAADAEREGKIAKEMTEIARKRVEQAAALGDPKAMSEALKMHELSAILQGLHGADFMRAKEVADAQAEIVRNRWEKGQPDPELN